MFTKSIKKSKIKLSSPKELRRKTDARFKDAVDVIIKTSSGRSFLESFKFSLDYLPLKIKKSNKYVDSLRGLAQHFIAIVEELVVKVPVKEDVLKVLKDQGGSKVCHVKCFEEAADSLEEFNKLLDGLVDWFLKEHPDPIKEIMESKVNVSETLRLLRIENEEEVGKLVEFVRHLEGLRELIALIIKGMLKFIVPLQLCCLFTHLFVYQSISS